MRRRFASSYSFIFVIAALMTVPASENGVAQTPLPPDAKKLEVLPGSSLGTQGRPRLPDGLDPNSRFPSEASVFPSQPIVLPERRPPRTGQQNGPARRQAALGEAEAPSCPDHMICVDRAQNAIVEKSINETSLCKAVARHLSFDMNAAQWEDCSCGRYLRDKDKPVKICVTELNPELKSFRIEIFGRHPSLLYKGRNDRTEWHKFEYSVFYGLNLKLVHRAFNFEAEVSLSGDIDAGRHDFNYVEKRFDSDIDRMARDLTTSVKRQFEQGAMQ